MPDPLTSPPSLGDLRESFARLLDQPNRRASSRLADAMICRDWIQHALLAMRCCYHAQTACGPHIHCESLLGRLLDDRPTTGRPEAPQGTDVPLDARSEGGSNQP